MKINSAKTERIEKWITISITFKGKTFDVSVLTKDGKVEGNTKHGLYTSYIPYFNKTSLRVREKHFESIKKHVERYIK